MRVLLYCCLSLFFLISCKPAGDSGTKTNDTKALEDQLMAMHDEVMPKLTDMQHLSTELRKYKTDVKENQEGKLVYPDGLEQNIDNLKLAEQGMWDWMKLYHDQRDSVPQDQLKPFLVKQIELMNSVKTGVENSISKAQVWLDQNHPANGK